MQAKTGSMRQDFDDTLGMSVALLCAVFLTLTMACYLAVSVWLTVQQRMLAFEHAVTTLSVDAMKMYHASNKLHQDGTLDHPANPLRTMEEGPVSHQKLAELVRQFDGSTRRVKAFFIPPRRPAFTLGQLTSYVIWYSGAAEMPEQVQKVWHSKATGQTIVEMLAEQSATCMSLCAADLPVEDRMAALQRLNDVAVNRLQPELSKLLSATLAWQSQNIQATRQAITVVVGMVIIALFAVWRGVIYPLLKRIAIAKFELAKQNAELERRVLERTESLSAALEIANDAVEARSNFLANMSHELRTPMNGVLGTAALLGASKLDEKQRLNVETIKKSGTLLLRIIDDVLDMSGLAAGKLQITRNNAVLADIVEDAVKLLQPVAREKGLSLELDLTKASYTQVLLDPQRIAQVLNNLIGNAVKFTDAGGVSVSVREVDYEDGVTAEIEIEDTGIGIPENQLDRIFEQFERVRNGTIISGAGLGLAISRSLVQEMGGRINVTSVEGRGSIFTIVLPLEVSIHSMPPKETSFAVG